MENLSTNEEINVHFLLIFLYLALVIFKTLFFKLNKKCTFFQYRLNKKQQTHELKELMDRFNRQAIHELCLLDQLYGLPPLSF